MKPEIEDTDIIIRRAANGWIVFSGSEYDEGHFMTSVYEDAETEWGEHEALIGLIREHFDLTPYGIVTMLDLIRPIYLQTAAYGHFGREDIDLSWERTDKAETLKAAAA